MEKLSTSYLTSATIPDRDRHHSSSAKKSTVVSFDSIIHNTSLWPMGKQTTSPFFRRGITHPSSCMPEAKLLLWTRYSFISLITKKDPCRILSWFVLQNFFRSTLGVHSKYALGSKQMTHVIIWSSQ